MAPGKDQQMSKVGIISNPASGKDIRRLIAFASVMDNVEKTNQIKRIVMGIDSTGVDEILIMPDYYCFGLRVVSDLNSVRLKAKISVLDMPVTATMEDTVNAAKIMGEMGVGCIVTLGGDGTNRAVAIGSRKTPLVPLSTGTNNVFPIMVEATVAGIAAGITAQNILNGDGFSYIHKRLAIIKDGREIGMALIDAVVVDQLFVSSRAVWELPDVRQIVCTRADAKNIGLTSVAGVLHPLGAREAKGLHLRIGDGDLKVRAAVLPGLFADVGVQELQVLDPGDEVQVSLKPSIIALDGEREVAVQPSDDVKIRIEIDGPPVVEIDKVLSAAAAKGFFKVKN
ncbi:MAG: NAD(+)/NADH kinase [Deltaproteobacteria bacterium]|nr:NAD(+)/NADH kinase [Deltaproteobacteria bacterium]